jgi:Domain of unknown function (DUF4292)
MRATTWIMLLGAMLTLLGCKPRQTVSTGSDLRGMDLEKVLAEAQEHRLKFKILTFKGKADFIDVSQGKSMGFVYRIDIAKDSLILINVSKFGIPAMNMLVSRDSVLMRMPINQTAMVCDYALLQKMAKIDLDFGRFQSILLGEAELEQPLTLITARGPHIELEASRPPYSVYWNLHASHLRLEKMRITDTILAKESLITYSGFKKVDGQMVASELVMEATQAQKVRIELHHSGIEFDKEKVNFRYRIPESYKIMPCDQPIQGQ